MLKYILFLLLQFATTSSFALKLIEVKDFSVPDDVAFFDEDGSRHFLTEFDNKTILLTFWATWCSSCVKDMPALDNLQKDFRKLPFEIIAVSQDFQAIPVIKSYYESHDIKYLKIYHDFRNKLFTECGIVGLPTSLLINQDGKVVLKFDGIVDWHDEKIRGVVLSHIPGNHSMPKNTYKIPAVHEIIKHTTKVEAKNSEEKVEASAKTPEQKVPQNLETQNNDSTNKLNSK